MKSYPKSFEQLIECFKMLPGIGEKNAERLCFAVLNFDEEQVNLFSKSIVDVKTKIKKCEICNNLSEESKCNICLDSARDNKVVCVVENAKNLVLFEKAGIFNGVYHVLDGLISPLNGINPEDININQLINRIEKQKIKEVILALNPSIEGETTSLYIKKLLDGLNIKITKIAAGIPVGADMEYLDPITIQIAMEGRKEVS